MCVCLSTSRPLALSLKRPAELKARLAFLWGFRTWRFISGLRRLSAPKPWRIRMSQCEAKLNRGQTASNLALGHHSLPRFRPRFSPGLAAKPAPGRARAAVRARSAAAGDGMSSRIWRGQRAAHRTRRNRGQGCASRWSKHLVQFINTHTNHLTRPQPPNPPTH